MNRLSEIRKAIKELSSREVKQALLILMLQLDLDETNNDAKADVYESLKELYNELLAPKSILLPCELDTAATTIHIVFGDSMAGGLKLAIKQQGFTDTNKVISLHDRFSMGPLWQLDKEAGRLNRSQWFRDNINDGYDDVDNDGAESYYRILTEQMAGISDQASIVIWSWRNRGRGAYRLRNKTHTGA